jgi:hypothetical protein
MVGEPVRRQKAMQPEACMEKKLTNSSPLLELTSKHSIYL